MRVIAVFDFDGTITKKDTFLEFIKFVKGKKSFYIGLLMYSPMLLAYKLRMYPNWKAKQKIFSYFFSRMDYRDFCKYGIDFSRKISDFTNSKIINKIKWHREQGHTIYVISASIEEWVVPWCLQNGITNVLSTKIKVDKNNLIIGTLKSKNCYGQEKVNRLLEMEPNRSSYFLYAYGDSDGDKEILAFANKGIFVE